MYDDTAVRITLPVAARIANGAINGSAVDLAGQSNFFRSAMLIAVAGPITDGTHTVTLQDSDDGTTFANVGAQYLQGSLTPFATAGANTVQRLAYLGERRYLRAVVTSATVTTGGTVGALLLLASGSGTNPVT
jgi:hypothetical protein